MFSLTFHDMPVGIEKAHDALAPAMFEYGMHVFYTVRRFQPFRESVKVVLLKIELSVLSAVRYGFGADKSLPAFLRLQAYASRQSDVRAEIENDAKVENFLIKGF